MKKKYRRISIGFLKIILGEANKIVKIEDNVFPFSPDNLNTSSPEFLEALAMKSHLVIRMLENRIGEHIMAVFLIQSRFRLNSTYSELNQSGILAKCYSAVS